MKSLASSFDQKDGVNILKGYMESGEFSRGKESIRAEGGIVMVGNLDVEVEHQQRVGHLLSPLPPENAGRPRHSWTEFTPMFPAGTFQSSTPTSTSRITSAWSVTSCPSAGAGCAPGVESPFCRDG